MQLKKYNIYKGLTIREEQTLIMQEEECSVCLMPFE